MLESRSFARQSLMVTNLLGKYKVICIFESRTNRIRSLNNFENGLNVIVDLDSEQGRRNNTGKNQFRLVVRRTKTVNLSVLSAWLRGQTSYTEDVNEAMSKQYIVQSLLDREPLLMRSQLSLIMFFASIHPQSSLPTRGHSLIPRARGRISAMESLPSKVFIRQFG